MTNGSGDGGDLIFHGETILGGCFVELFEAHRTLDLSFRMGLGLEGVMNASSDGLTFIDVGVRQDSKTQGGNAGVPGRGGIALRGRAPFWLIPGDLILAAPILAFTKPSALAKMGVQSANGGLIPWQAVIATRIGRIQFVLGREVGVSLYGFTSDQSFLLPTPGVPARQRHGDPLANDSV